jgi:hypothetical protein
MLEPPARASSSADSANDGSTNLLKVSNLIQACRCDCASFEIGEDTRAGIWLTSTNTMIAELVQDWSSTPGQKLMPLMMADVAIHPID